MASLKAKELNGNLWGDINFDGFYHDSLHEELAAFKKVMLQGITLTLHSYNGPRPIKLYLNGSE